ncbi:FAD-binding oxidoreductase [Actinoplanes sp. NPDC051470]|uniref:FAD-binding oxidoreductase n=1 Tax=Actinoplanes sp. NPDC051470 TaxID=3157224 RepID=UPI003434AC82
MVLARRTLLATGAAALVGSTTGVARGSATEVAHGSTTGVARGSAAGGARGSEKDWAALDASLDGSVERPGSSGYDAARRLYDPRFDGVRPPAVARCAHAADVAEAVNFARRNGVPVVLRGGGHSYVGASTSASALVLDLRRLAAVGYDAASRTATIGGGARLMEVYERLGARGVSIPSGSCGTVGISGITSGGGIGMASAAHGMTCDAVVGARLVTADGRERVVDAARDPELFWALRGGGGGQFGVVTQWRMRTFPAATTGQFTLAYPWADASAAVAGWQRAITGAGGAWSSFQFIAGADRSLGVRINGFVIGAAPDDQARAIERAIGREPQSVKLSRRPYLDVVHDRTNSLDSRTEIVGSDVFAGPLPERAIAAIMAAVRDRANAGRPGVAKLKQLTGAPARVRTDATAFPWRGSHTLMQWLIMPGAGDAATVRDAYAWIDRGHRAVAPWSAGRYVNYLEPDPARLARYHGPNLARLRRVRATADPGKLFRSAYAL